MRERSKSMSRISEKDQGQCQGYEKKISKFNVKDMREISRSISRIGEKDQGQCQGYEKENKGQGVIYINEAWINNLFEA